MNISRRDFLKYCAFFATSLGISSLQIDRLSTALANPNAPSIIWLNGAGCSGCSVSFLNTINQTVDADAGPFDAGSVLIETINLVFHQELMSASGEMAVRPLMEAFDKGNYILIVEGGIPTAYEGKTCILWTYNNREVTCEEAVKQFATKATTIIALGSCAAFGGISAAGGNPTGIKSLSQITEHITEKKTVALPGCPTLPDALVTTLVKIFNNETLELDKFDRPTFIYGKTVHSLCPRRGKPMAETYGLADTCLMALGCKGPKARANCPTRKWNEGINWCVGAGGLCIGCVEASFPGDGPLMNTGEET